MVLNDDNDDNDNGNDKPKESDSCISWRRIPLETPLAIIEQRQQWQQSTVGWPKLFCDPPGLACCNPEW
jgi:hypothetical protein